MTYDDWIRENVQEPTGMCADATAWMVLAFPELRRVRGHYYCSSWGERDHWWLVTPDGTIVDPTKAQFPSGGKGVYVECREGDREPTGCCPQCGNEVYDGGTYCSEECHAAYAAYYMNPW